MIPIDIGPVLGTAFGSSDELSRIESINNANFRNYKKFYSKNPQVYHNDTIFVNLINILREFKLRKLNIRNLIPNIADHLQLVYRNRPQVLHGTHLGKLLIVPIYDSSIDLCRVLYSDATDLNYDQSSVIESTSFVTLNIKLLVDLIDDYDKRGRSTNALITDAITIPLYKGITDYALFNTISSIEDIELGGAAEHPFYMNDLNAYVCQNRKRILNSVSNLDTNPLDVLSNMPTGIKLEYNLIEDDYIDNLLWINLLSYYGIVNNGRKINRDRFYDKFFRSYSLYAPRGRGDKYFTSCSSELLDKLEEVNFI